MRWSESITIYLAAGAPFGVSRYLCAERKRARVRSILEGLAATLLWPLALAAILFKRLRHVDTAGDEAPDALAAARIEEAGHAFRRSVAEMFETLRRAPCLKREELEQALYALREAAEQYVSLATVKDSVCTDAAPAAHEMELARLSGRRGQDLLLAGLCARRRNVSRILSRYERERARVLRKLRELRAEDDSPAPSYAEAAALRELVEARLEIYLRARDLFYAVEDDEAARHAAGLVDEERSGLVRLQGEAKEDVWVSGFRGEERCTEPPPQLISKDRQRETTFTQG